MAMDTQFSVKIRGARGGYPMPGPTTIKYGGNTTCFEVRVGGHLVIVDAGTGIISLGREMMAHHRKTDEPMRAVLLFTHLHHDHTQGMPFFTPFLDPHATLYIYGARPGDGTTLEDELIRAIQSPLFPLGLEELYSRRQVLHIRGGDTIVLNNPKVPPQLLSVHDDRAQASPESATIDVHYGYPHPGRILNFRVNYQGRSLVIATDTEGFFGGDRRLINFARGADVLLHDAEYDEHEYADQTIIHQGWGHSTWRMATEVAQAAGVKQLGLLHHNPGHSDNYLDEMERKAQAVFPATFMAREGQVVSLL
jgi:phosphoribosyl 1,2-cyclic phosphodiesterase